MKSLDVRALLLTRLGHPPLPALSNIVLRHQGAWSIGPRSRTPIR
jgi:hypothetical protein